MHYPTDAFGKWPWSTTIQPKGSLYGVKLGQREDLSRLDVETMRKYYGCVD